MIDGVLASRNFACAASKIGVSWRRRLRYETDRLWRMEKSAQYSTAQARSILPDGLRYIGKEMEICMSLEKELQKRASGN